MLIKKRETERWTRDEIGGIETEAVVVMTEDNKTMCVSSAQGVGDIT